MLGGDARGGAVGPAEHDLAGHLPARHIKRLRRRIDQLVDRLHGEIPGHELDDRFQPGKRGADAEAGKAVLGDRRVDDALGAELLQQPLRDLVGALIFGDLLAHHEHVLVAPHLLGHGVAQGFAHGHGHHFGAGGNVGVGGDFGFRCSGRSRSLRRLDDPLFLNARLGFRDLFGHRRGNRLRCLRRGFDRRFVLALAEDHRDRGVDRDVSGTFGHQDLAERAFVGRLDFHRRLVGLDLGDDVARLDAVAFLLEPLGEVALLHRRRQRGHEHFGRHRLTGSYPDKLLLLRFNGRRWSTTRTDRARDRAWRIRRPG